MSRIYLIALGVHFGEKWSEINLYATSTAKDLGAAQFTYWTNFNKLLTIILHFHQSKKDDHYAGKSFQKLFSSTIY